MKGSGGLKSFGRQSMVGWLLLASLAVVLIPTESPARSLTVQEKRGRELYLKMKSPSGAEIKAFMGRGSIEAPGWTLPCVSCHGLEGEGLSEHGISATAVTWEDLTRPRWFKRIKTREHPPYDEAAFARAVREGIDPAGNRLDPYMPRFVIASEDLEDLIAYLKVIGRLSDPGVSDNAVKLGTVLPAQGVFAELGQAMRAVLEAFFDEINQKGGIYNRKIELIHEDSGASSPSIPAALNKLIEERGVFAVVSPFTLGADQEAAALAETHEVPMIGPFTLFPEDIHALNRYTFYLLSGLREMARANVVYAGEILKGSNPAIAVVFDEREENEDIAQAVEDQAGMRDWTSIRRFPYGKTAFDPAPVAGALQQDQVEAVFFLGPWLDLRAFIQEAERRKWYPFIFVAGVRVTPEIFQIPAGFNGRVVLAYPTLPSDQTAEGMKAFHALIRKYDLAGRHTAAQVSAYCAAAILVEGIKAAGGRLSREKLVRALDGLFKFETHLIPPVTYNPNRRIGALGAHVVTVDLERKTFSDTGNWIGLD